MRLEGRTAVAAPPDRVWAFLLDPASLASCVPGVEEVRQLDEATFEGRISASIGPLTGHFTFRTAILGAEPPSRLVGQLTGTDSVTGSRVSGDVRAELTPEAGGTTFAYTADVRVEGRLSIVGDAVLRATAGAIFGRFASCLSTKLAAAGAGAEGES